MIRLNMIVEGQTEETFVRDVLAEHLLAFQVYPSARRAETGRKRILGAQRGGLRIFRGGMTTYQKARNDILRWIKQEKDSPEVFLVLPGSPWVDSHAFGWSKGAFFAFWLPAGSGKLWSVARFPNDNA